MVKKKLCFVIMPFSSTNRCTSEQWTEIFNNVHKPAVTGSRLGYRCVRSNIRTGAFIKDILMQLNQADVVLADLTDMNPNVFYELGVRHTLRNRTILVSQTMDDVPSDLRQYGVITYETTPNGVVEYKKNLNNLLRDIRDDPDRADNPVSDYLHQKSIVTDPIEAKLIEKKLLALVSECSFNLEVIDNFLEYSNLEKQDVHIRRFRLDALELLTSTYYIYPNEKYIKLANQLLSVLMAQNTYLDWQIDPNWKIVVDKTILENFPTVNKYLKNFMQTTNKIVKDFRNQNYIEPNELVLCISDEKYKKYLK